MASGQEDFNTEVMQSTFQIVGPSAERANALTTGTVFLMGKPSLKYPGKALVVMFTANHVLAAINGESATVNLRANDANGSWHKKPFDITIRKGTNNLWTTQKKDIAAMLVAIPQELLPKFGLISTEMLATEKDLRTFEIHPGDQLSVPIRLVDKNSPCR
jgi:hypothetical protein